MNGYGFFFVLRTALTLGLFVVGMIAVFVGVVWNEISREISFHNRFGDRWKVEYEDIFGPVSQGRMRIGLGIFGILAILAILIWLFRHFRNQQHGRSRSRRRSHRASESALEHNVRCRRNALVGIYFGVPAILASVAMEVIYFGIFAKFADQQVLGVFIFVAGYVAVISGCWWWLKAKGWNEGVVMIGVAPILILFIPFVRLIFLATPALLVTAMVMAPLVLIVVVLTLPDKNNNRHRHSSRFWKGR